MIKELIEAGKDGMVNIHHVSEVAGLDGDPEKGERYRSGTFEYYVSEKIRSNDPKAVGPFIFASLEMERLSKQGVCGLLAEHGLARNRKTQHGRAC